jgi:hypothetical protein
VDEHILLTRWTIASLKKIDLLDQLEAPLFNGELILLFEGISSAFAIDVADPPARSPEETNAEITILGPRDGFIEEISVNIALIRKRLKTRSLAIERSSLGRRSRSHVALLYLKDVIRPELVEEARARLAKIDVDVIGGTQQLEDFLTDNKWSLFPLTEYTGRPDFVVAALLRGRFAILLDGAPTAIIAPANLTLIMKSGEDLHFNYLFVLFGKLLRMIGLVTALLLPGFYIAITTYHQDQIPLPLLATLVMSRKGVPFPTPLEAFLMLQMFELFREAGIRLPNTAGQPVAVVGGLIIGDAAIRAGMTSPTLLIVIAISAVAKFTLVNQALSGTVMVLRVVVLFVSSFFGIFGFLLSMFMILIYMANLRSFGVPYLAPISPFHFRDFVRAVLQIPFDLMSKRPKMLNTVDGDQKGNGRS